MRALTKVPRCLPQAGARVTDGVHSGLGARADQQLLFYELTIGAR